MGEAALYFGWRTALLGLAMIQCLLLAAAVAREPGNRVANRFLAAVLIVIAGILAPYAIGFAGAYDRYRWLTFAPFALPLALGPLMYGYAHALTDGTRPRRLGLHLTPPVIQLAYFSACFALPQALKWSWYTGGHRSLIGPVLDVLGLVSLALYAWAIGGVLRRQRRRLADQRSDDDRFSARWLSRVQAAILVGLLVEAGFWLWAALAGGIDFFQETGLYLCLAALGLYLGAAGWRHAALPVPLARPRAAAPDPVEVEATAPDWAAIGAAIAGRTRAEGWWREPDLTLARLARLLGTNSGRLSRAINQGLNVNFSVFVNGLRAEAVAQAIEAGSDADLLDLAFEMGFASKASFNRAFQARFGLAPSVLRRRVSNPAFSQPPMDLRRGETRDAASPPACS